MMRNQPEEHFKKSKMEHTKIKHYLFSGTLKTSLSIANMMIRNSKYNKSDSYTYIDLFAGSGKFTDDSNGSPLIAIDITANHLKQPINVFNEINLMFIEKNKQNADELKNNVDIELKKRNLENLKVNVITGDWEQNNIKKILQISTWGLVFADPFSTELHLNKLKENIDEEANKLKDVLIFTNFNTAKRQKVRDHMNDEDRICNFLGISPEMMENENFEEVFKNALQKKFKATKKFAIGVAIPISVEQKVFNSDYFYMVLFTNSFGLGNAFLEIYEEIITQYRTMEEKLKFNIDYEYSEELKYLKNKQNVSLCEFLEYLYNDFLSFKKLTSSNGKVPTIKNVVNMLNKFKDENYIKINCDEGKFIYKINSKHGKKGELNSSKIQSKPDLQNIKISYIP
ncbi:MAG: three-Cys-motif partner protein TcmP [bacterium]